MRTRSGKKLSRVAFGAAKAATTAARDAAIRATREALEKAGAATNPGATAETNNDVRLDGAALVQAAFERGINVIDTAAIYGNGESEKAVGEALAKLSGEVPRQDVFLVSKFGYRIDSHVKDAGTSSRGDSARKGETLLGQDMSSFFGAEFLRSELENSLERLGTSYLDSFLLHDPEHFLEQRLSMHNLGNGAALDAAHVDAMRVDFEQSVLLPSFVAMEECIAKGSLRSYGVCSRALYLSVGHPHRVDWESALRLASSAAQSVHGSDAEHSFAVLQIPVNPFETGGLQVAQDAQRRGIFTMGTRPLTGIDREGMWRLVERDSNSTPPSAGFVDVRSLPSVTEMMRCRDLAFGHFTPPDPANALEPTQDEMDIVEACAFLRALIRDVDSELTQFTSVSHYEDNVAQGILPAIDGKIDQMDETSADVLHSFFEAYGQAVRDVVPLTTRQRLGATLNPLHATILEKSKPAADDDVGADSTLADLSLVTATHDISDTVTLHDYALDWSRQTPFNNIIVGMTTADHVATAATCILEDPES